MGVFVEGAAGGGVDNSKFATAKAANIEKGYTAEVKGELVTGTLEIVADAGEVTITNQPTSITINHGLGVAPTKCFLVNKSYTSGQYKTFAVLDTPSTDYTIHRNAFDASASVNKTATTVTFNCKSGSEFYAGTYCWAVVK